MLLGHIVCKDGVCVDLAKITMILNMEPPTTVKQLRSALSHIGYYRRFICNYALIISSLENLLKKVERFV